MLRGRVFHLEDDTEWIDHVRTWLGDKYDLYSASSVQEAAELFHQLAADGLKVDLAIIDISMILGDAHDKQGLEFIEALEKSDVLPGYRIIVLSAYSLVDQNWRVAFRDYQVVDVFDKGDFPEAKEDFIERVNESIDLVNELP